jgi:hypothetical protein
MFYQEASEHEAASGQIAKLQVQHSNLVSEDHEPFNRNDFSERDGG